MSADDRYSRQTRLWGADKQAQIENASVLVAGAGGLGGTLSQLLVRAGVKQLTLIDDGQLDWPDLNRQTLYCEQDIGQPKVACAEHFLQQVNSRTTIVPLQQRIDDTFRCPDDIDLVVDCLDNYEARFRLEETLPDGTPLIHGAVEGEHGQVLTLKKGTSQSLAELYSGAHQPTGDIPVTGASATLISALMTNEVYQVIFGTPQLLNRMLVISLTDLHCSFLDV